MSTSFVIGLCLHMASMCLHPLHVSVTEIAFDEDEKELEIIVRIFTDDLEKVIQQQQGKTYLDLLHPPGGKTTDDLVRAYLAAHFSVSLDGKIQMQHFLGHELDGQAMICYVQVAKVRKWKTLEVMNNVLMEKYDDQSNIVHVTVGKEIKSVRLVPDNFTKKISFED